MFSDNLHSNTLLLLIASHWIAMYATLVCIMVYASLHCSTLAVNAERLTSLCVLVVLAGDTWPRSRLVFANIFRYKRSSQRHG